MLTDVDVAGRGVWDGEIGRTVFSCTMIASVGKRLGVGTAVRVGGASISINGTRFCVAVGAGVSVDGGGVSLGRIVFVAVGGMAVGTAVAVAETIAVGTAVGGVGSSGRSRHAISSKKRQRSKNSFVAFIIFECMRPFPILTPINTQNSHPVPKSPNLHRKQPPITLL